MEVYVDQQQLEVLYVLVKLFILMFDGMFINYFFLVKLVCCLVILIHLSLFNWIVSFNRDIFVGLNGGVCLYDLTTLTMRCQCCGLATGRYLIIN